MYTIFIHVNKKHILIIDDDRDIVTVLSIILEGENYHVTKVYSGNDALKAVKASRPDMILLDYMLPDINGDEVVRIIREDLGEKTLPIILISAAHDGKKIAQKARLDGYIAKPFEMDELLKKIAKLLYK